MTDAGRGASPPMGGSYVDELAAVDAVGTFNSSRDLISVDG